MYSYSVKNVKSFKNKCEVELKPLTIFVGKNSCGKSSLMRFPIVLKQTLMSTSDSPLVTCGSLLDYGNFEDVVFGKKGGSIEFGMTYEFGVNNMPLFVRDYRFRVTRNKVKTLYPQIEKVSLLVTLSKKNKKLSVDEVSVLVDGASLASLYKEGKSNRIVLRKTLGEGLLHDETDEYIVKHVFYQNYYPFFDLDELAIAVLNKYKYNAHVTTRDMDRVINNLMDDSTEKKMDETEIIVRNKLLTLNLFQTVLEYIYRQQINEGDNMAYIGPFRESPSRVYRDSESQSRSVGVHGENVSTILIRDFQNKKKLINKVSDWLSKTMGYRLSLKEMGSGFFQVMLIDSSKNKANIMDVGYGISQVLPIVIQILSDTGENLRYRYYNSAITRYTFIEQPEIHLHPAAQAELADLFVSAIDEKKSFVVETHSEHFIRKLQVLVADKKINFTSDMVKIYYVDKDKDGLASVEEIQMGDDGRFIKAWPSGFFDKAHELSMSLLEKNAE